MKIEHKAMMDKPSPQRGKPAMSKKIAPLQDYGFFGPESPAWKVWSYPTGITIGFQRSVVVEELDPFLLAAVNSRRGIYTNPKLRFDRTISYFAKVALGDAHTAIKASDMLMKVHAKAVGIEPVSGRQFDANDPDSQLWILLTGWHSVLYAYERFGPGKLSPEEEGQYWDACAVAAELQTCDPDAVPRTREGIRDYFEEMRPRLAASELTQSTMRHLLRADLVAIGEKTPTLAKPFLRAASAMISAATVSLMPKYMRDLAGIKQPALVDLAVLWPVRMGMRVATIPKLGTTILSIISPLSVPIAGPALNRIKPINPITMTPAEAREQLGTKNPRESYLNGDFSSTASDAS